MIIAFYLFLTWFSIALLFTLPGKLPRQPFAFVFLLTDFLNTNIAYLLSEPFGLYVMATELSRYISFALYQSLILPALYTLLLHAYIGKTTRVLLAAGLFLALDLAGRYLNLYTYHGNWQLPVLAGYHLLLLYLTHLALRGFERMCRPAT